MSVDALTKHELLEKIKETLKTVHLPKKIHEELTELEKQLETELKQGE